MKKWIIVVLGSLLLLIFIAIIWEFVYLKTTIKQEVFILPQGFKGIVLIAYDQKDGLEDVKEDGKLIYKISQNGVLKLKRKEPRVLSQSWYYFEDAQGKRTELAHCFAPCDEMKNNPDRVFAYGTSNGGFGNAGEQLEMTTFLVGSYHDKD
nr:hypothetical protein [Chitinophagaceae bacterium]